jgi:hypothetical protein
MPAIAHAELAFGRESSRRWSQPGNITTMTLRRIILAATKHPAWGWTYQQWGKLYEFSTHMR